MITLFITGILLVWAIGGALGVAWWHDRQARRPRPDHRVTARQVCLGGPLLWLAELVNLFRSS